MNDDTTLEKPVLLKDLRLLLAGPNGPCIKPPAPKRIRGWVDAGMPCQIQPGARRKEFILSDCIAWLAKRGIKRGDQDL